MSNIPYKVIIIPGLGDNIKLTTWVTKHWRNNELEPVVYSIEWNNRQQQFPTKLDELKALIDRYVANGNKVSLVGCSAGASAAFNAFFEKRNSVSKAVSICGRLRTGNQTGFRSFGSRTKSSPAFAQSVKLFESREPLLSEQDRKRIMTVRALFGDELVPTSTATLPGAYNITIPTPEHSFSINMALKFLSKPIIAFIQSDERS